MKEIQLIILFVMIYFFGYGQIPIITSPQPATMNIHGFHQNSSYQTVSPTDYWQQRERQRTEYNNQQIIQEYKRNEQLRQQQNEVANFISTSGVNYYFPSNPNLRGKTHYLNAYNEFEKMLRGEEKASVKKAVFLTENAYYENTLSFEKFDAIIDNILFLCDYQMTKNNLPSTDLAKNFAIYQVFADTVKVWDETQQQMLYHYPLKYDFCDYRGDSIWENQFVTKLMMTETGQCHSMPLLYLILAEEMNAKAWLSYSPKHTYIKFKTGENTWQNYETTNGTFTTDAFVLQSGYIKSEALVNKVYMDTLSKEQTIAHCLLDLAKGYERKYGYDNFYLQCVELALEYHPNNIVGLMMKSNYYNSLWYYVRTQQNALGGVPENETNQTYEIYLNAKGSYDYVQEIGYADMPEEAYQQWLQSANKEKSSKKYNSIKQALKVK